MLIVVPKEGDSAELRAPLVPESAAKLVKRGAEVLVQSGIGLNANISDTAYENAGARVTADRSEALQRADVVVRIRKPSQQDVSLLKRGCVHISFLDPFNERHLIESMAAAGVSAISMEMIPRTTRAQKMDALSSQASLAGYVAVILAADRLNKILPMMMTPAGTISPSRVFVIGAGVAGLQAIATAKRLGARVDAFDTRPIVEEQVRSLGAKFVKIDLGETGQTKDGYAKELTPEQQQTQRAAMAAICSQSDIVITTAQLFGRRAPVIVTRDMIDRMKPGSVIVDLAVETGGNVEGSTAGEEVDVNGVKIIGLANLPGRVSAHASQMYSSNVTSLVEEFWNKESKTFTIDQNDEIIRGCLITHGGEIVNETIKTLYARGRE
ncbi:MAG TPA: Re/Si-specific NAD(P)(+) transhydrogenase subunit alpha [Candidatus Hydrogenedentes bacterium]|nr:Re/Si-specific NAD(P)(+) transhydrogenase subunit alpha [Candidatus Hydrogenedentota bacterium]HRK35861.1 Re/Si-specific NAD(P)(+) transhydrogenase subunit alpha [Candidatus Hydrogenedentota bacterium]